MTTLHDTLQTYVDSGEVPGAVGLVAGRGGTEVAAVGTLASGGESPMRRDAIFRIASASKPILAASVMILVEDGLISMEDRVDKWLPELASIRVLRTPGSELDDTESLVRPITLFDLMTFRSGYGFPSDFSLPGAQALFPLQFGALPITTMTPDEWIAALAKVPALAQPGDQWLYNASADILSVLVPRVSGQSLPDFLSRRIFEQLGMPDTGFEVPLAKRDRFTSFYDVAEGGALELADAPDGKWASLPSFPSGAGGLVSTVDDWWAFAQMLLGGGEANGARILGSDSVDQMMTDYLTDAQREASRLFIEGQGWGFGGQVDVATIDPWNVVGRYGWIGGSGTTAFVTPSTGAVDVLFTQRAMTGPTPPEIMREFWRYAA
jgi:CubicO group peptidase (beta-lactamase class C family)